VSVINCGDLVHMKGFVQSLAPFALLVTVFAFPDISSAGPKINSAIKSVLEANGELPPPIWRVLVEARSGDGHEVQYFLVFNLHGTYFSYDAKNGSRRIWPSNRTPIALARAAMPTAIDGAVITPADFVR
jgi:hypothetical protein